ncbi:potassium transporter TrkA, partial [Streptomyces sp. NPDC006386]
MGSVPNQGRPGDTATHMIVCGDDGLAHRLAAELRGVYGEQVRLVVPPSGRRVRQPVVGRARAASAA